MSVQFAGLLGVVALVVLIFLRIPVAVGMGLVGFVGYGLLNGWNNALRVLGQVPFDIGSGYTLSQLPLFVLMGDFAMRSGMSAGLYDAARTIFVGVKGSQAFATLGACAAFGSVSGSSVATAATMTRVAMPELRRAGYDDRLSAGTIAAGGTLGILIPPSIAIVVYAIIAEQSVPRLYAAAMIPGFLLTALYMLSLFPIMWWWPQWVPKETATASFGDRMRALLSIWEVTLLLVVVLGGLYLGWFTATESAAIGAFGAWALGVFSGKLKWSGTVASFADTIRTTCILFTILFSAVVFTYFVVLTQIPNVLVAWINTVGFGPKTVMILMAAFYVILGCFLEAFGMLLITVPVFLPVVVQSGYDGVWFGIYLVILIELGLITPPVGMNIFVMQGELPDMRAIQFYEGVWPFLFAPVLLTLLLIYVPEVATWLPSILFPAVR